MKSKESKTKQNNSGLCYYCMMYGVQKGENITVSSFLNHEEVQEVRKKKAFVKDGYNLFVKEMFIIKALKIL